MDDYSAFYTTLGVNPETDWKTLRSHYKRLIAQWHPDRFLDDTAARKIAEERCKQITIAYQALENHRREHGVLPPRKETTGARGPRPHAGPAFNRVNSNDHATTGAMGATADGPPNRGPRRRIALALFILIPALYLANRYSEPMVPSDSQSTSDIPERPNAQAQAPAESPRESGWIWIGSTIGEVYAVQGVPTFTQGEIWHYGKSRIYFSQGKVTSWIQHPDNPLRIGRDQPVQIHDGNFDIGSTKDEVRAIQGIPVMETDAVWDYGPSRVYFKNNRVIRWEESPMQPLRVAH